MKNSESDSKLSPSLIARIFGGAYISTQLKLWRSARRFRYQLAAVLNPIKGCTIKSNTYDISESGVFVIVEPDQAGQLEPGQLVRLNLELNSLRHIRCEAVVTRVVVEAGPYPIGYGVQFVDLDSSEKRRLKKFLQAA